MLFYQGHLKVATVNKRRTKHTPVLCRKCSRLPTASFFCAQMYAFAGFLFLCLFCFVLVVTLLKAFLLLYLSSTYPTSVLVGTKECNSSRHGSFPGRKERLLGRQT